LDLRAGKSACVWSRLGKRTTRKGFEEAAEKEEEEDEELQQQQDAARVLPPIAMAATMSIAVAGATSIAFRPCARWNVYKMGLDKLVVVIQLFNCLGWPTCFFAN
jgi:hypothetical protein